MSNLLDPSILLRPGGGVLRRNMVTRDYIWAVRVLTVVSVRPGLWPQPDT